MEKKILGRYKERKLKHFGLDYVKAKLDKLTEKPKISKLGLSVNSHIYWYNENTYIEFKEDIRHFDYYFELRDKETGLTLAFLMFNKYEKQRGAIEFNDIFEITGIGFLLRNRDLKFYLDFLKFAGFKIRGFKRVDICFDMEIDTDYIYSKIFAESLKGKTHTPFIKKGKCESFYIGDKMKEKNTYQLIRIYDKNADSKVKGKGYLYSDYIGKNITRFEVEIRRDKAKFLTTEKLLDINFIFSVIVKTFYGHNIQFFKFLHFEDFQKVRNSEDSLYKKRLEAIKERQQHFIKYGKEFYTEQEELKILATFITYAKRLVKNGYSKEKLVEILETRQIF